MARLPNTKNDVKISSMIAKGASVANVAEQIGVSEPTVYKAIKRLALTLPSKSKATDEVAKNPDPAAPSTPRTAAKMRRRRQAPTVAEPTTRRRPPRAKRSAKPATAALDTAPVATLVPVSSQTELLTERVDKGIELLRNLSAQIVRRERELAAARARYAETLSSLALD